jgi:hypothetical protein
MPKDAQAFLTYLWELSDGTRACVVEHLSAPRWELCMVRHGHVVYVCRCETVADLMARSLAEFVAASERERDRAT